jgi:MFS family permease
MGRLLAANRPVAVLWAGQAVSQLGDKLTFVALPILALQTAGGDLGIYALLIAATVLPNVLFGWAVGALVDRLDRRRLMAAVEIGRCLCVVAMATAPGVAMLLVLVFVNATFGLVFRPALTAAVPTLVRGEDITRTQALMEGTGRFLDVFGFLAAGAVALAVGVPWALRLDAATFVVSAVTLLRLPLALERGGGQMESFGRQVRAGFAYHRGRPLVRDSLGFLAALTLGIGAYNALIVPAMASVLHQPLAFYGYWMAVQSVGAALGSYLVAVRPAWLSRRVLILGSVLLFGVSAGLIGQAPGVIVALGLAFLFGAFNMGFNVTIVTWLQESVPGSMLGRVFALRQMVGGAFVTLGTLAAGAWAGSLGVGAMITLAGIYFVAVAAGGVALPGLRVGAEAVGERPVAAG